jgi:hypothetical protein
MAHQISADELRDYLEAISKPDLIAWLVERCQNDEGLRTSLLDLATPKENAAALVSEIRDRLHQAWQLAKHRDGWKMALPISRELDQVLASIQNLIDKGCPREAQTLLVEFLTMAEHGAGQVDDSDGHLDSRCDEAMTLWGQAWAKIEPRDVEQLAGLVYERIRSDGCTSRDKMISKFAEALGTEGLRALQARLKGDLEALPQPDLKRQNRQAYGRTRIIQWLKEIADALGNVDEYIALVESEQQSHVEAVPIARRLFAAGRLQEALAYVEKCTSRFASSESSDYPKLKSQILVALGRKDEAREILWQEFADYPSMFRFEPILALTPDEDKAEARKRAAALAESHRSPEQAAYFLVQINDLDRAAQLVQQRLAEMSGMSYTTLAEVAQALAQSHPLQAWNLYRILLLDVLNRAHSKAYHHAADYLMQMEELSRKTDMQSQQAELVAALRQTHGRKSSFWAQVRNRSS